MVVLIAVQAGFAPTAVARSTTGQAAPAVELPQGAPSIPGPDPAEANAAGAAIDAKPNEDVARRTPTSDVVENGDGTQTTTLYSEQVYYKPQGATVFQPIRVGFAPVSAGDKAQISSDAPVKVEVAPASDSRGFLSVDIGGHTIRYKPVSVTALSTAADRAPIVDGSLSDASEVIPGLGARVLARADGAHVFFILDSAADAAKLTFQVDAPDLAVSSDDNGGFEFRDLEGGLVARMPNPYAVDSTPDGAGLGSGHTTNKVSYALAGTGSPWTLTITVDPTWLAGATYPVFVDPTIVNGGTSTYGDTFTNPGNPTFNYGNYCRPDSPYYCEMWLGQSPSPTSDVGSDLIRFDLTPVLATTIDTASLQIFPYHQYLHTSAVNTWIRQVTSTWTESTTYNSRPSVASSPIVTGTTTEGSWSNFNVLGIVANWIHAGQANYGFRVDENGNNYTYWKRVVSAEETGSPHAEKLVITNHVPVATVVEPTSWTADQTVSWSYADSKGAAQSHYHVDVASDAGFASIVATSGDVASSTTSYAFSASLTAGAIYYWRVKVKNGTSWSAFASHSFGWDPSVPNIGAFSQPGSDPTYVGPANTWTLAWPLVTSGSGISALNVHQDSGPVITPGTCADATVTASTQWSVSPTATSYQASGGLTGTCYWYYLDATNGVGTNAVGPTSNPVLVDLTAPTVGFAWPPAGVITTATNPSVEWTETENGSGITTRSLQRQVTTVTGPGTCAAAWANDGGPSATPSPVAQTTIVGSCYQWILTVNDASGNQTVATSSKVIRDASSALGHLGYQRFETWSLGSGDELAVNIASGNAVISHPIVSLPIRGSSLSLGLTYNSQDTDSVAMGAGWRLNVHRRLTLNADGTVTYTGPDGARNTFSSPVTVGSVTTYTRPPTLYANLVKDTALSPNEFILTYRDQSKDKFDILGSEGILVRAEDRFGNGIGLAYVPGTNRISTISDTAASRPITFAYDAFGRVSSITDWAWIDASGIVQGGASGSHRVYRFFYDGTGKLAGWADPLNAAGSCPTAASHLTCMTYPTNELDITKSQTVTVAGATSLSGSVPPRTITTKVLFAGSSVASVRDAQQVADGGVGTVFTTETSTRIRVDRPTTTRLYGLVSASDQYDRIQSVWRRDTEDGVDLEQRTLWDSANPAEPASVTDNNGAQLATPAVTTNYTYVANSMGLVGRLAEPLTPSTNRRTDFTYTVNNDVLTKTVSQDGASPIVAKSCYSADCTANNGLTLVRQIENYVAAGAQNNDTNVTTDSTYDAYGQKTRETRHDRDATGAVLDDRATGTTFDSLGAMTSQIGNYADGVVTNGTSDTLPDATGARTDLTSTYSYDTAGNQVSSADPRRAIGLAIPNLVTATFAPTDDAHVRDANPTTNYGSATIIETRATGGSQGLYEPFLKFTVTGIVGTVTGAKLRLYNTANSNKSTRNVCVHRVATTTWTEATITNANKPAGDAVNLVCITGNQASGSIDYVLPASAVTGPGIVAVKLTNDTTFDVDYASKENGANPGPQLIVTVAYGPLAADDYVSRSTFDALNQNVSQQSPKTFGLTDQKTSSSVFDELGATRLATDTGGVVTGTEFDRAGRATKTFEDTDGAGAGVPATTSATTYDADGHALTGKDRNQVAQSALGYTNHG